MTRLKKTIALIIMIGMLLSAIIVSATGNGIENAQAPAYGDPILPHKLSENGQEIIETQIVARDYANIILAQIWNSRLAPSGQENKLAPTQEVVRTVQDALKYFVNADGSVVVEYRLENGVYVPNGVPEVRSQALGYSLVYAHHSSKDGGPHFNYDAFAPISWATAYVPIKTAVYSFNNMADKVNGGFYQNINKTRKNLEDQAFGLYSIQPLVWIWQKHPTTHFLVTGVTERQLQDFAIATDEYLKTMWSSQYGIYADSFKADGSPNFDNPRYDLRTIGYLMWGHNLLDAIIRPVDAARADALLLRAKTFFDNVIVDGITYKTDAGIPREIRVNNGVAAVGLDETNTGRLFDFVHAIYQYQRPNHIKGAPLNHTRVMDICKAMVLLGAQEMQQAGVLIHDFEFSDTDHIHADREVPYIGAYITAAGRVFGDLSATEKNIVRPTIASNIAFIKDVAFKTYQAPTPPDTSDKPFNVTGNIDRTAGIKASATVARTSASDHAGNEVVIFQLMKNGTEPVSIVALEKDITSSETLIAHFNVTGTEYSVKVFVFDSFNSNTATALTNLAAPVTLGNQN